MSRIEMTVNPFVASYAKLLPILKRVIRMLSVPSCVWHIEVVKDARMKALHKEHLDDPTTTDVLTFDLRDGGARTHEGAAVVLDTVVCVDEARRRAKELGHDVHRELLLYCIHSLLHVQGYDDLTKSGAAKMHAREDEILEALGLGRVYSPGRQEGNPRNRKRAAR